MGEIIVLQVGGCGNRIGINFWDAISSEHCIDMRTGSYTGKSDHLRERVGVYYEERKDKFIPRSVLVDLDNNTDIDKFPHNERVAVSADGGMSGSFAKGFYAEGEEHSESVVEKLQKLNEKCERLQGFHVIHSMGGGTGAGMGSLLINKLRDEFPDRIVSTFSVLSARKSGYPTEPYNHVLAINQLCENSDETFCFENEALYDMAKATGKGSKDRPQELNPFITHAMAGATSMFRYPKKGMSCMRQIAVDMAPFPRLHFFTIGFTPPGRSNETKSVADLTKAAFDTKYFTTKTESSKKDLFLSANVIYAGKINSKGDTFHHVMKQKEKGGFVDWVPNNLTAHYVNAEIGGSKSSATLIANSTSFMKRLEDIFKEFNKAYDKKEFLEAFTGDGMDETEIEDAKLNMKELISDYIDCIEGRPGDVMI